MSGWNAGTTRASGGESSERTARGDGRSTQTRSHRRPSHPDTLLPPATTASGPAPRCGLAYTCLTRHQHPCP
eukprot:2922443-Rhodomonas_salina.1